MRNRCPKYRPRQNLGFTLVEILIALVIGLFLMGALLTIVQANRTAPLGKLSPEDLREIDVLLA